MEEPSPKRLNVGEHIAISTSKWSQALEELLDRILKRLPLSDWLTFGSVCTSWRSAMLACCQSPLVVQLKPPYPKDDSDTDAELCFLYLSDGSFQDLSMKTPFYAFQRRLRCFSHLDGCLGWLAVDTNWDFKFHIHQNYLLNPMSRERIDLPPFEGSMYMVALSAPPASGDCMVIAYGRMNPDDDIMSTKLASCKLGGTEWSRFDDMPMCSSMAFHKGKLYVHLDGIHTKVYAFDPHARTIGLVRGDFKPFWHSWKLVVAGEELLLVAKTSSGGGREKFYVFRLEGERWVRITRIGDRVLLLSDYNGVSLSTKLIVGSDYRANCIYDLPMHRYLAVFSMEDGSYRRLHLPRNSQDGFGLGWLLPHYLLINDGRAWA